MSKRELPEINAGSMADIAFLLLIFFLVTTTMDTDLGIIKKLPERQQVANEIDINERNVLEIIINHNNELMVNNSEKFELKDLRHKIIDFIDNGAGLDAKGNPCDWCNGKKDQNSSDHPAKAVIILQSGSNTSYGTYISVQNEINAAYRELRDKLAISLYGKTLTELENTYKSNKKNTALKEKIKTVKEKYPVLISETLPEKQS